MIRQISKQVSYRKSLLKGRELTVRCPAPADIFYNTTAMPKVQEVLGDWKD